MDKEPEAYYVDPQGKKQPLPDPTDYMPLLSALCEENGQVQPEDLPQSTEALLSTKHFEPNTSIFRGDVKKKIWENGVSGARVRVEKLGIYNITPPPARRTRYDFLPETPIKVSLFKRHPLYHAIKRAYQ